MVGVRGLALPRDGYVELPHLYWEYDVPCMPMPGGLSVLFKRFLYASLLVAKD